MLAQRNKNAVIGLAVLQVALLAIYGALTTPLGLTYYSIDTTQLAIVNLGSLGFVYINHYKRDYLMNTLANWALIFIFASQITFIFIAFFVAADEIDKSITLVMNGNMFMTSLPSVIMLTLVYANLRAFLKLQDLIIVVMVGIFGYCANIVVNLYVLDMYDFGAGLSIYLFGCAYYFTLRVVGMPVRILTPYNKHIPITNNMAIGGIIFSFLYFQDIAGGFIGDVNTIYCQFFAIVGYLIFQLTKTNSIRLQRVFEITVGAGVLMSVGGTFFQNFAAPCSIGLIFGLGHSFIGERLKRSIDRKTNKIADPARILWIFGLPAVLASIIAFIGIAQYDTKSTNKMGTKFPYPEVMTNSINLAFKQLGLLPISILMGAGTGIFAGLILKNTSDNNLLEVEDLVWNQEEEVLPLEQEIDDDVQRVINQNQNQRQTPYYVPPQLPGQNQPNNQQRHQQNQVFAQQPGQNGQNRPNVIGQNPQNRQNQPQQYQNQPQPQQRQNQPAPVQQNWQNQNQPQQNWQNQPPVQQNWQNQPAPGPVQQNWQNPAPVAQPQNPNWVNQQQYPNEGVADENVRNENREEPNQPEFPNQNEINDQVGGNDNEGNQ